MYQSIIVPTQTTDEVPNQTNNEAESKTESCGFQFYRHPLHHEGLPTLIEVFRADDFVYFGALNEGFCEPEWRVAHNFMSDHTFICEFPDGSRVTSDPLPPGKRNDKWTKIILVIRCTIPQQYVGEKKDLTVSLHGTKDMEADSQGDDPAWQWPSSAGHELGVYRNLHVCPREWPQEHIAAPQDQSSNTNTQQFAAQSSQQKKRTLSMVTQIRLEYDTFEAENKTRIRIPSVVVIAWLEYHHLIGFEHFYIFDNDEEEHGPMEDLLRPYVKEGLVTYVWYPMQDCVRKSNDEWNGSRITTAQAMSSMMSLRRYEHETEFMGHFDVDEYIQLPANVSDVKDVLLQIPRHKPAVFLPQQRYHDCDKSQAGESALQEPFPLDRKLCVSMDLTPGKSIMRTKEILGFFVHMPWVRTDHSLFNWGKDNGYIDRLTIAHVRGRRARDGIPIENLGRKARERIIPNPGEPLFLVARAKWRSELKQRVKERMRDL